MAWTRVDTSLGMLGGGAAAPAEGNHIVMGNDVENQAPPSLERYWSRLRSTSA